MGVLILKVEMYENVEFRVVDEIMALPWQKNPKSLYGKAGVYMIREKGTGKLLYVGRSGWLGSRLARSHPVYRRDLHDVYIIFTSTKRDRYYLEERCITILKPPLNKQNGASLLSLIPGMD